MPRGGGKAWLIVAAAGLAAGGAALRARQQRPPNASAPSATATTKFRTPTTWEVAESIYDRGFAPGWSDTGWGPHQPVDAGPLRVGFGGFGGLLLHHEQLSQPFGAFAFRYQAPSGYADFLQVSLRRGPLDEATFPLHAVTDRDIAPLEGGWREVLVPWRTLNPSNAAFDSIVIEARRTVGSEWVELDKLLLTKPSASDQSRTLAAAKAARVQVTCAAEAPAISPLIYGIASGVWASGETAHRVGGNAMTRLNWDLGNVWNTGSDWFFENVKGPDLGLHAWLAQTQAHGIQMAVTVPTIGWVAKDATSVGFPRSTRGPQRKHDPGRPEAGDGVATDGKPLPSGPPNVTSEEAPPERIKRWVQRLREEDPRGAKSRVSMYFLDNEPDLWHETHRDVHPSPLTYDELLDRTLRYGTAIREADPDALIAGPSSWGWSGYFYSAKDTVAGALLRPDRRAHQDVPLIPWYLRQLAEHERRTGVRVLDVLDVHYYPQAQGVYGNAADPATAALRLRSTRSLWDPTYKDESWIDDEVQLLPRLRDWVKNNYPGRRISLGEWSFGAEDHISGGLATAEALGRFGAYGLDSAFYWAAPAAGTPTFWAFRAYRNYDGKGAHFLDYSLETATDSGTSAFASRDQGGQKLVLVVLNLDADYAKAVTFETSGCGTLQWLRSFVYTGSPDGITPEPAATRHELETTLPPYSFKIIELGKAG